MSVRERQRYNVTEDHSPYSLDLVPTIGQRDFSSGPCVIISGASPLYLFAFAELDESLGVAKYYYHFRFPQVGDQVKLTGYASGEKLTSLPNLSLLFIPLFPLFLTSVFISHLGYCAIIFGLINIHGSGHISWLLYFCIFSSHALYMKGRSCFLFFLL